MNLRTIIAFLILIPITSASYAPTALNYNHKSLSCFDCHNGIKIPYAFEYDEGDECSGCHTLYNQGNFSARHEPLTCKGCHLVSNKDDFHSLHTAKYNVSCTTCHTDNKIPDNTYSDCLSCHISGLHSTHLEKKCEMCHPNTIPQKIIPTNTPKYVQKCDEFDCWNEYIYETNNTNGTKSINTSKPITDYKKVTIYEILVNLIKAIRDDVYG